LAFLIDRHSHLCRLLRRCTCNDNAPLTPAFDYSATSADRQTELQRLFDRGAQTGRPVILPAGIYRHSGILYMRGIEVSGAGGTTILEGTTRNQSAIVMTGKGSKLHDLKFFFPATTRSGNDYSSQVLVKDADTFEVYNLFIDGSDSVGVFMSDAHNGVVRHNYIRDTLADSIHITNKSSHIVVHDNTTFRSGDDSVSVVSYLKDGIKSGNVEIYNNAVIDSIGHRGLTVVGGEHVQMHDNYVRCTPGHGGIYIASEKTYDILSTSDVVLRNNVVQSCSNNNYGAIMVFTSNKPVDHVLVEKNTVLDSPLFSIWVHGEDITDITLKDNVILRPQNKAISVNSLPSSTTLSDNVILPTPK